MFSFTIMIETINANLIGKKIELNYDNNISINQIILKTGTYQIKFTKNVPKNFQNL